MRILFVFAVLYFFSFAAQSAVDYSRCQAYMHPEGMLGSPQRLGTGTFGAPLPFRIKPDGTLEKKDFADVRTEDGGKTQIFSMTIPGYSGLSINGTKIETPDTIVEYTVTRDDKGRITHVRNAPKLTTAHLQELHQMQIDMYNESVPEAIRKANDAAMGEGKSYEPPFSAYKGQSVSFDYKEDNCYPSRAQHEIYLQPKADGESHSLTVLDTQLCRDINEFVKANPEASACFRKDINDRMNMIFKKHAPKYEDEGKSMMAFGGGFGGFGGYGGMGIGGFGGMSMMGSMAYQSIAANVLRTEPDFIKYMDDKNYLENARRFGNSPVMNGQRILQNCFDVGVRDVIEDEELWATATRAQGSSDETSNAETR